MNGKLIVFEGIDCSGKTTQAELLKHQLKIVVIRVNCFLKNREVVLSIYNPIS